MAALLVALAVMSVLMSAVLPAWRHQAKREKEAELVFRGEQYARAIALWERKMGPGSRPATLDMLVQQKFLRKKYKDPMTEDGEFQPVFVGMNPAAMPGGRGGRGPQQPGQPPAPQAPAATTPGIQVGGGGIQGVVSKSKEASIRIYKGATYYNQWTFIHASAANQPGGRGAAVPGGRGAIRPGFPGQGGQGGGVAVPGGRGANPFEGMQRGRGGAGGRSRGPGGQ